jgi:hypothetical protein
MTLWATRGPMWKATRLPGTTCRTRTWALHRAGIIGIGPWTNIPPVTSGDATSSTIHRDYYFPCQN